jgi:hypothetical protein
MSEDLKNTPLVITVEGRNYALEYDNNAYVALEQRLGKGIFRIYDEFIDKSLTLAEYFEVVLCGLLKYHKPEEEEELKKVLQQNNSYIVENIGIIAMAFIKPFTPPPTCQADDSPETGDDLKKKM